MKKILIVDDSKTSRMLIKLSFPRPDPGTYEVHEADSGRQCLDLYRQSPYDLVFLDLVMPDMDGFQTLEELKKLDANAKVVVVTAGAQMQAQERALELGALEVYSKSSSKERMKELLEKYL